MYLTRKPEGDKRKGWGDFSSITFKSFPKLMPNTPQNWRDKITSKGINN